MKLRLRKESGKWWRVARRVRAWIETFKFLDRLLVGHVARRVRAWIETFLFCSTLLIICVARRVRAWIETPQQKKLSKKIKSPAVCGRGLKRNTTTMQTIEVCRPPCAGVD